MAESSTIRELENLKRELLERVEHINKTIATLKSISFSSNGNGVAINAQVATRTNVDEKYSEYDNSSTIRNKIAYVLKKENRFLHVREIATILHSMEPEISEKDFTAKISPAISALKTQGTLVRYQVGKSNLNVFWGSKNWLDENGEPKEQYKYNDKQLSNFGTEKISIE